MKSTFVTGSVSVVFSVIILSLIIYALYSTIQRRTKVVLFELSDRIKRIERNFEFN